MKRSLREQLPTIQVTGRHGSGMSTVIRELRKELTERHIILEELRLLEFVASYREGSQILLIDTPAILCTRRLGESFKLSARLEENNLLSFVTDLPFCTIVKNERDIDTLRVHIKKLVKKL